MWFQITEQEIILFVLIKPNAHRNAILAITDQGLQISVRAMPKEGEANKALIEFLAKELTIPKSQIKLEKGQTSRFKKILLPLNLKTQAWLEKIGK